MRLLAEIGDVCADYQDRVFRNLRCRRLQLDETWAWIYCKQKNRTEKIARDTLTAWAFVEDIAKRVRGRLQITTGGYKVYLNVIE